MTLIWDFVTMKYFDEKLTVIFSDQVPNSCTSHISSPVNFTRGLVDQILFLHFSNFLRKLLPFNWQKCWPIHWWKCWQSHWQTFWAIHWWTSLLSVWWTHWLSHWSSWPWLSHLGQVIGEHVAQLTGENVDQSILA